MSLINFPAYSFPVQLRTNARKIPVSVQFGNSDSESVRSTQTVMNTGVSSLPNSRKRKAAPTKAQQQPKTRNDDWTEVTEPEERRRIQNRIAQRKFREKIKETKEGKNRDTANLAVSREIAAERALLKPGSHTFRSPFLGGVIAFPGEKHPMLADANPYQYGGKDTIANSELTMINSLGTPPEHSYITAFIPLHSVYQGSPGLGVPSPLSRPEAGFSSPFHTSSLNGSEVDALNVHNSSVYPDPTHLHYNWHF